MKTYTFISAIFLLLATFRLQAQSFDFKHYQVNHGLSNNTINCILQDTKGFLWFGTRNGLNRFDGKNFKVFRPNTNDPTSIGNATIHSMCEDIHENLWVGTSKGVYMYNSNLESFSLFGEIPMGTVTRIKSMGDDVWFISDGKLYKYNIRTKNIESPKVEFWVKTIFLNTLSKKLYAVKFNDHIEQIDLKSEKSTTFNLDEFRGSERRTEIQDIYSINDSLMLIGTFDKTYLANFHSKVLKDIFADRPDIKRVQVHSFIEQRENIFWIGTEAGIYIYNIETGEVQQISKQRNNPYSLTDNAVLSFYKDKEESIWVGTFFGGVNFFSDQYNNFKKYLPDVGSNAISGNLIHEICNDQYGNLWIGTEDEGLNKIDAVTGIITNYRADGKKGSIAYNNIHGLAAFGDELWIGTLEHGLDVMDIRTGKVIRHYDSDPEGHGLVGNFIISIYRTKKDEIFVTTWNGMFLYDRRKDRFIQYVGGQVQTVRESVDGKLFIATYGNGVYIYGHDGAIIQLRAESGSSKDNSLINNFVNGIFEDHKGDFWFCTEGGLSRYDRNGVFTNYTMDDGLPDNQVFRIEEDENYNLWISSGKGLVRLNPASRETTTFGTADGLPTEQFNYNSSFKGNDGTIYFGTTKGMISFRPSAFIKNNYIPPVYISNILINNQEPAISNSGLLKQSVVYEHSLRLPHDSSNLTFDIAALSYISSGSNRYTYIMEGYDEGWTTLIGSQKIYYNKLPPGSYRFRVKGANNSGLWNNTETVMSIVVTPPWWSSGWAYLFYILFVGAIIFLIFRYYLLLLKANNARRMDIFERRKEREIYNLKLDFFTNLAHEIRTPLTLIKMPLDKMISSQNFTDKETSSDLMLMQKNTTRLVQLTNQLLDFRKAETDDMSLTFSKTDINSLLSEVFNDLNYLAKTKSVNYELDLPRISLAAYVDEEALKKIFTNLIQNAIKYAETEVSVKLLPFNSDDNMFHVEFRNDGTIIPAEKKEKIFEPFYRLNESEKDTGTGIGLPLSRSLAELHNGTLMLVVTQGESRNIFLLSIPIFQGQSLDIKSSPQDQKEDLFEHEIEEWGNIVNDTEKPVILLVEDNREILAYLNKELSTKYTILRATNGLEALDIIDSNNVQLVVSDIMMPVMDGIALCKRIKSDLQYSHIPVIFLTAKNALDAKIYGLESGADAYIEKPFALDHLLAQIKNTLNNRQLIKSYFTNSPVSDLEEINVASKDHDFITQLNKVIYDNISEIDLNVDELSKLMNMSRPTLYRKIKGLSDLTPNELIMASRLKKAVELLTEKNYRINEIAMMVGYSVQSNFSRDFHKHFGITPTQFIAERKTNR